MSESRRNLTLGRVLVVGREGGTLSHCEMAMVGARPASGMRINAGLWSTPNPWHL